MEQIENNRKTYSYMYLGTAILHVLFCVLFIIEHSAVLALINAAFVACYIFFSISARKSADFDKIFKACGIAIIVYVVIHQLLLGMDFGYQYIYFGSIPVIFYLSYINGKRVKESVYLSLIMLGFFVVSSIICSFIPYPLFKIEKVGLHILLIINMITAVYFATFFLRLFLNQALEDTDELTNQNSDLENTANVDTLTGLRNRRSIDMHLNRALARAKGEGHDFTILMCDVDNFKKVNDTYGHDCGDEVLKNIANIIQSEIRPEDIVFRYGGEEILILVNAANHIAKKIAERCRASIEASSVTYKDITVKVTITIGGASYFQGVTTEELIERADANLYTGKGNGKNQVVI